MRNRTTGNRIGSIRSKKSARVLLAGASLAAVGMICSNAAQAATDTWTGNGDGNWATANDWNPVAIPAAADALVFTSALGTFGSSSITDNDAVSFSTLTFSSGAAGFTIAAGAPVTGLTLTGALTDSSANNSTQTFNLGITGAALAISGGTSAATSNNLTFNTSSSFTTLTDSDIGGTDNIQIAAGQTLTFSGGLTFASGTLATGTDIYNFTGTGSLNVTSGGLTLGNDSTDSTATLTLPNGNNSIAGTTITIGAQPSGSNGAISTLKLGTGSNILDATNINIGANKASGVIQFASTTGSVTIGGATGGTSVAAITIGNGNSSGTRESLANTLLLAGHTATVNAGTVILGESTANSSTSRTDTATITFDTGTFNCTNLEMGIASGASTTTGVNSTFTLGSTSASTGVLNVTGPNFWLTDDGTAVNSTATFSVVGGTANIGTNIVVEGTSGTSVPKIVLSGGTLNMQSHAIGAATGTAIAMTMPTSGQSATLSNLGGAGINGTGLAMGGTGTLILGGTNTYTGDTAANSGTLLVNGTVANTASANGGTLGGTGTINGLVTVNSGTLTGGAGGISGALNLANGLTVSGGTLAFDIGTTTSDSLNITGGSVAFNGGTLMLSLGAAPANGSMFNIITSNSPLPTSGLSGLTTPVTIGRTTLTPSLTNGNDDLTVTVSGNPASLTWNNSPGGGDGMTWDTSNLNWTSTAASNPYQYFDGDNVTFNDSNNFPTNPNAYNVVLNSTVNPGSVIVTTASAYTISGGGSISGATGLTLSGGGSLTLATSNAYTGVTTISGGSILIAPTLANIGTASSIGEGSSTSGSLILDGGTLQWTPSTNGVSTNRGFTLTQNGGTLEVSPTAGGVNTTISGAIAFSGSGARTLTLTGIDQTPLAIAGQTLSANITDAGAGQPTSVVKNGNSGWVLSGTNSYTGGTTINAGRLRASSVSAFGMGGVTVANGAEAYLGVAGTYTNSFMIAGIGVAETATGNLSAPNNYGALRLGASGAIVAGTVTMTADSRITARSATTSTNPAVISGPITGNYNLEFGNTGGSIGYLVLSNINNNWNGNTTVSMSTLRAGANSTATAGVIPHGAGFGNVILNGGDANGNSGNSTLDLNGFNVTINGLSSTGTLSQDVITNGVNGTSTLTVGDNNSGGNYGGMLQDSSSTALLALTKIGAGTETLSGSDNYSGGTTVAGGVLQMGAGDGSALGNSAGNLTVNSGSLDLNGNSLTVGTLGGIGGTITSSTAGAVTLNVNTTANATFAGSIQDGSGTVALTLQNTGTLTLSGANTNSGDTNLYSGTLIVTGSTQSAGNVNVYSNTVLAGTGSVGHVNLNGGTINPGTTPGTFGTLTMSNLTVNGGNFQFDIGSGTNDKVVVAGDGVSTGIADFNGGATFTISSATQGVPAGTYTLLTSASLNAGQPLGGGGNAPGAEPTLVTPGGRQVITLDYSTPNEIILDVSPFTAANLIWNDSQAFANGGSGDGQTWDVQNNQNWTSSAAVGNPNQFYNGDNVTFNDSNNFPTNPNAYNVNLNTTVNPSSITVNTANAYTINGGGAIGGTGGLTLLGGGSLVLADSGTNTYSGGTAIQNGTLQVGAAGALPIGTALSFGDGSGTSTSTLDLDGNNVTVSSITTNGGTNTIGNSGGSAATLTYAGSGPSTFSGTVQDGLNSGGSQVALTVSSGALNLSGPVSFTGNIALGSAATLQISGAHTESLAGAISGAGNLTVGDGTNATVLTLPGANSYSGVTTIGNHSQIIAPVLAATGTNSLGSTSNVVLDGGDLQWTGNAASTMPHTITLTANGGTLDSSPTLATGATIAPGLTISGPIAFTGSGPRTFTFTGTDPLPLNISSQTISSVIGDAGAGQPTSVVKTGNNGWLFSGANTYSGGTTIESGRIRANTTTAFGSGPVTVDNGATAYMPTAGTFINNFFIAGIGINETGATVNNNYGVLRLAANGTIVAGTVTLTGDARITGRSATGSGGTITGQITGGYGLEFGNASAVGVLTITNTADNWTGDTTISLGTLKAGAASTATTGVIPHGAGFSDVVINGGDANNDTGLSTFDLNGFNVTINGLSSSGVLAQDVITNNGAIAATLTVGDGNGGIGDGDAGGFYAASITNGTATIGLTKIGTGLEDLIGVNSFTGDTNVNGGVLLIDYGGAIGSTNAAVNVNVAAAGTLNINGTVSTASTINTAGNVNFGAENGSGFLPRTVGAINITGGITGVDQAAVTANRQVLITSSLTISAGKLDLTNNDMIVHNGSQSAITTLIASGYNGGPWNGTTGITSSVAAGTNNTALGVELNSNGAGGTLLSSFDGQTVNTSDVLVKYTYFGDANLDGVVNGSDYTLIDNGFNNNLTGWHNGDFNYDGIVNGDDYTLIDNAFNTQGPSLAGAPSEMMAINTSQIDGGSSGSSAVPEPTSLGLLAIGAMGLLGHRRRRVGK